MADLTTGTYSLSNGAADVVAMKMLVAASTDSKMLVKPILRLCVVMLLNECAVACAGLSERDESVFGGRRFSVGASSLMTATERTEHSRDPCHAAFASEAASSFGSSRLHPNGLTIAIK